MESIFFYIIGILTGSGAAVAALITLLIRSPEKVEKWMAMGWKALNLLGRVFKGAHKQYVRLDLQGRLNEFAKGLGEDAPFLASTRVHIEWTDDEVTRKNFLRDDKVILRLRRNDPEDRNFVHGAYMFVSASMLAKGKRYLSPSQRQSLDLYMTTELLEKEKPTVLGFFLDEYLHPETKDKDSKITKYFDSFAVIDKGGLFKSVVLQELNYLGDKVFGQRQDDKIISEVNALIEFLEPIATRQIGGGSDLNFQRLYCRFAIVIVGKPAKVIAAGHLPYVDYVRKQLIPRRIETLYLVSIRDNRAVVDEVCNSLDDVTRKCALGVQRSRCGTEMKRCCEISI